MVPLVRGLTPIRLEILEAWLLSYPKKAEADYLMQGFRFGFRIPALGERKAYFAKKLTFSYQLGEHSAKED